VRAVQYSLHVRAHGTRLEESN